MAKRKPDDWQLCMSFDAETHAAVIVPVDLPGEPTDIETHGHESGTRTPHITLPLASDALPPPEPAMLSPQTRVVVVDPDGQAPTVMAGGIGSVNTAQYTVSADDVGAVDSSKPPYRIPLMAEVNVNTWNGLTIVSTFSGCGGSCLGFKMAGYRVAWANEFVPAAQDTYRANHPATHLDTSDIRTVTAESIRAVIGDVEIDVLEGSPPCASFSTAGKGSKGWGQVRKYSDVEQRTDDLFEQYIRLIGELNPRAFVAENVAGMVKGVAKGFFLRYLRKMKALPYNVEARLVDAQWLGVPQRRVRVIFVGVRKDVGYPAWPQKLPYRYSIRDAIPWIGGARVQDRYGAFTTAGKGNSSADKKTLEVNVDGPTPTVRASLADQFAVLEPFVEVPDLGRRGGTEGDPLWSKRRSIDEPMSTIKGQTYSQMKACSTHWLVEGAGTPDDDTAVTRKDRGEPVMDPVVIDRSGAGFAETVSSIDEPCAPIQASTHWGEETPRLPCLGLPAQAFSEIESRRIRNDESVGENVGASIEGFAIEKEWDKLKPGESSDKYINLVKADPELPSPTVTASGATTSLIGAPGGVASVTHPFERRKFTIAELRRICGFPDDFILTGTYAQQWERMGRAVPPPMMGAIAAALVPVLTRAKELLSAPLASVAVAPETIAITPLVLDATPEMLATAVSEGLRRRDGRAGLR